MLFVLHTTLDKVIYLIKLSNIYQDHGLPRGSSQINIGFMTWVINYIS